MNLFHSTRPRFAPTPAAVPPAPDHTKRLQAAEACADTLNEVLGRIEDGSLLSPREIEDAYQELFSWRRAKGDEA